MKKIVFFKLGALGDVLMTTPLIREVRKKFPDARIDYWVGSAFKSVLEGNINIDRIIPFDENIFFKKNIPKMMGLIKQLRKERYDIGFVMDKHWIFSLVMFLGKVKERNGFKRDKLSFNTFDIDYKNPLHEIDYYLMLGEKYAISTKNKKIDLFLSKKDESVGRKYAETGFVAIINSGGTNPGESGSARRMPDKLFEGIVKKISQNNSVILIGGKKDNEYYNKFKFDRNVRNIAGKTTIKESAAIMRHASKIITTDCGAMHVASTVNGNIVCVFGPTNPERKAPLNKGVKLIWKDAEIYDEKYELYGKAPKNKNFFKKIKLGDII